MCVQQWRLFSARSLRPFGIVRIFAGDTLARGGGGAWTTQMSSLSLRNQAVQDALRCSERGAASAVG
jgi:hypothetical protein